MDERTTKTMCALEEEITGLKAKIADLRLGRRVLMNLLDMLENKRRQEKEQLEREIGRLRLRNSYLARLLWERNRTWVDVNTTTRVSVGFENEECGGNPC
ncbi:MAG: translation initiation factor 2 [bacterium]